jgi:hypothetical protein
VAGRPVDVIAHHAAPVAGLVAQIAGGDGGEPIPDLLVAGFPVGLEGAALGEVGEFLLAVSGVAAGPARAGVAVDGLVSGASVGIEGEGWWWVVVVRASANVPHPPI